MSDYGRPLYAPPSADISPDATWTLTAGTANAIYPVTNLGNRNPALPFKATGTSFTARATFGSPQILVAVALINHDFAGASSVSITSGSGMSEAITIPANGSDGLCKNPWLDLIDAGATLSQRTSTTFDIVVITTVLGPAALGEVLLLTDLNGLNLRWGVRYTPQRQQIRHRTWGGTHLQYDKKIRIRKANGMLQLRSDEAEIRQMEEEAIGGYHPFLFIEDEDVNDAWYVQLVPGSFSYSLDDYNVTQMPFEVQEVSQGPPLFA